MKLSLVLALTMLSSFAFAGEKYICRQTNGDTYNPMKMVLTQVGDDEVREGKFYAFKLEIFKDSKSGPVVSESVNVRTEDVMFRITNTRKKITGMIYLDEMDQAWINVGNSKYDFDCN